jgi:hypothetical protein
LIFVLTFTTVTVFVTVTVCAGGHGFVVFGCVGVVGDAGVVGERVAVDVVCVPEEVLVWVEVVPVVTDGVEVGTVGLVVVVGLVADVVPPPVVVPAQ